MSRTCWQSAGWLFRTRRSEVSVPDLAPTTRAARDAGEVYNLIPPPRDREVSLSPACDLFELQRPRVPPGEYVVELVAGDQVLRRSVTILQDHWYDK